MDQILDPNWLPVSAGLQERNQNQELLSFDIPQLLEGLDYSDFLTSPSPNGYLPFDDQENGMETTYAASEESGIQVNPENLGGVLQNIPTPFNDPMMSVAPMAPHAVPAQVDNLEQSQSIDSNLGSFSDIEPMRLGSAETRETMMADPTVLRESLRSIELNASSNASSQQMDDSQGPGMAVGGQAVPDSSQTTGTSPDSSTRRSPGYFEDYDLPDHHQFKVSVKFMSKVILEENVKERNGCLLHYQPPGQPPVSVPAGVERITIPDRNMDGSEFQWVKEKQKRFTEWILQNFVGGVEFCSREGNIYAKRKSNTKLFWHNETQTGRALELKRNEETEVFNWNKFQVNLASHYSTQTVSEVKLPAVWFSFAQKWDRDTCPITTKLVSARVDPVRACEMVKNVNPDVRSTESLESLHTSLFAISNGADQSASH